MCNFLSTLRLGVSPSFFNKKSDEFGQLYNAELLRQKEDEAVLSSIVCQNHAEEQNLPSTSVLQVSNVQGTPDGENPTVVPVTHVVCGPTLQTCEADSSTHLGSLSSTQLTPSNVTNPHAVPDSEMVTGATMHTVSAAVQEGSSTGTPVLERGNTVEIGTENGIGPGWKIAFDNLDIFQRVREMTEDNQNKDHHWINHVKVTNRVSGNHLPDDKPLCDSVMELENYKVIPTGPDHISQRGNYIRLIERVLTEEIPYLSFCKDVVTSHIPHHHAKEMTVKSEKVRIVICLLFIPL